ncbi:MAG: MarR family transcriptional regulator [Armatimonadota bacterium]
MLLLIALAIAAAWLLATREHGAGSSASSAEGPHPNLEGQIMAMLHQAGKPLGQIEIALALDVATARVAVAARELEHKGWITRTWDPLEYTYHLELPTQRAAQPGGQP